MYQATEDVIDLCDELTNGEYSRLLDTMTGFLAEGEQMDKLFKDILLLQLRQASAGHCEAPAGPPLCIFGQGDYVRNYTPELPGRHGRRGSQPGTRLAASAIITRITNWVRQAFLARRRVGNAKQMKGLRLNETYENCE